MPTSRASWTRGRCWALATQPANTLLGGDVRVRTASRPGAPNRAPVAHRRPPRRAVRDARRPLSGGGAGDAGAPRQGVDPPGRPRVPRAGDREVSPRPVPEAAPAQKIRFEQVLADDGTSVEQRASSSGPTHPLPWRAGDRAVVSGTVEGSFGERQQFVCDDRDDVAESTLSECCVSRSVDRVDRPQ